MRQADDIEQAMERHADTVWRVCGVFFRAHADAQDAFQDTFMKYALADGTTFHDDEHRKAWLIRVATNICKDMLKTSARKNVSLEEHDCTMQAAACDPATQPASFTSEVVDALRTLDDPPRTPLYLSLYEGYSAPEIARMIDAPLNTVYSWISRGKKLLKEALS